MVELGSRRTTAIACALADEALVPVGICSARYIANLWQNQHNQKMNHKLPTFAVVAWFTCLAVATAQTPASPVSAEPNSAAGQGSVDGSQLVAQAAKNVDAERGVKANLRYRVQAFGHQLAGSGTYLQRRSGAKKFLRLELKTQVGDQVATVQEICGEEYYWIRRQVPQAATSLGRVNLSQLQRALDDADNHLPAGPGQTWVMLGGLSKLLEGLHQNFDFETATASELEFALPDNHVDRLPVWIVRGSWKPDHLAALLKKKGATGGELPAQIPERVELILGRSEKIFPLFPYRITYLRHESPAASDDGAGEPAPASPSSGKLLPLITLELFDVAYPQEEFDPLQFEYNHGDQEVDDLTLAFIKKLGGQTR